MSVTATTYKHSLSLLTDLYQISMALGYWKCGLQDTTATFYLSFRKIPYGGDFALLAGLQRVLEFIQDFRFDGDDLDYLSRLNGNSGLPLFPAEFLSYLRDMELVCDVAAIPEGTPVFADMPVLRVSGPLLQCQLLESPILNFINFETLIATKAARICLAAENDPVLEFGLRRAHGIDGAISAARAAHIGGCTATSNLLAGKLLGIPVQGTHAHSWVLAFEDEPTAFRHYAAAMPDNCVFLVDTYQSHQGIGHAIQAAQALEKEGHRVVGIRLDSGDLAHISRQARRRLDAAGLEHLAIVASGDLDESSIARLKQQGAPVSIWAVGTRLVTGDGDSAMAGVYKLSAIHDANKQWRDTMKLSDDAGKLSYPGILEVKRLLDSGGFAIADVVYDKRLGLGNQYLPMGSREARQTRGLPPHAQQIDLLRPVVRKGKVVTRSPALAGIRSRAREQLSTLAGVQPGMRSADSPEVLVEERVFRKVHVQLQSRAGTRLPS